MTVNSGSLETLVRLVQNGSGATLLPELATRLLTPAEKSNQLLRYLDPMPSREVSVIYGRRYQKQGILTAIKTIVSAFDDGEPHEYRRAVDPG